jgi:mRNA interferase MazF
MNETEKPALPAAPANDAAQNNDGRPARVKPSIIAAPQIRQIYWCDFWPEAHLPEMWKRRPVVVLSYRHTLYGVCSVVACSTDPQEGKSADWGHELSVSLDGRKTWAACNHIYTVATSRLHVDKGGILRLPEAEFNLILTKVLQWLPRLPEPSEGNGG